MIWRKHLEKADMLPEGTKAAEVVTQEGEE